MIKKHYTTKDLELMNEKQIKKTLDQLIKHAENYSDLNKIGEVLDYVKDKFSHVFLFNLIMSVLEYPWF